MLKMVKYQLRDTNQEVKIGDKVAVSYPISTPYGTTKHEFNVLVTQESLKQLIKDGLVIVKNVAEVEANDYKPFIRRLARKHEMSFNEAIEILNSIKAISPFAHNCLMLELMAEVFNKGRKVEGIGYTVNLTSGTPVQKVAKTFDEPVFVTLEDARRAVALLTPLVIMSRHDRKQED